MDLSRFLLVDRIEHLDPAAGVLVATARVPSDHVLFEGHFPGRPLLPGTIQTELMAQAAGLLVLALRGLDTMAVLAGIDAARFRRPVAPGASLRATARLGQASERLVSAACDLDSDGAACARATIRVGLFPQDDAVTRRHFAALAKRIGLALPEVHA